MCARRFFFLRLLSLLLLQLSGLPPNPELYKNDIMRMFDDCGKGKQLHFDHSRSLYTQSTCICLSVCLSSVQLLVFINSFFFLRVYLEFERQRSSRQQDSGLSSVLDAVYVALQKRCGKEQHPCSILALSSPLVPHCK